MNGLGNNLLLALRVVYMCISFAFWFLLYADQSKYEVVLVIQSFWIVIATIALVFLVCRGYIFNIVSLGELLYGSLNIWAIAICAGFFLGWPLGIVFFISGIIILAFVFVATIWVSDKIGSGNKEIFSTRP